MKTRKKKKKKMMRLCNLHREIYAKLQCASASARFKHNKLSTMRCFFMVNSPSCTLISVPTPMVVTRRSHASKLSPVDAAAAAAIASPLASALARLEPAMLEVSAAASSASFVSVSGTNRP